MAHRIVVTTNGKESVGYSCPFWTTSGCSIKDIDCRYGLTEIDVPDECPLRLRKERVKTITEVEAQYFKPSNE